MITKQTSGILFAICTGVCWAVLAIGLKYALHYASSGTIVWVRMVVASVLLTGFYLVVKPSSVKKVFQKPSLRALIAGLFLAANYYSYMTGLELTTAANAQIMIQLGPLGLLFLGVFYFKESLNIKQWAGIGLGLFGFVLFNWDQFEKVSGYFVGNAWIIFAAVTWAIFAGLQKIQIQNNWSPQEFNIVVYTVCTVALFPLARLEELSDLSVWQWLVLASLGLNTIVAYGAFGEALHRIPASIVSLIVTVNPLITIAIVTLFAYYDVKIIPPEPIEWRGYLGAMLVVIGVGSAVYFRTKIKKVETTQSGLL